MDFLIICGSLMQVSESFHIPRQLCDLKIRPPNYDSLCTEVASHSEFIVCQHFAGGAAHTPLPAVPLVESS